GRPDTAVASPAQALLPPGLPAAAPHHGAGFGGSSARPLVGQIHDHGPVHQAGINGRIEHRRGQFNFIYLLALQVVDGHLRHNLHSRLFLPATVVGRISTMLPRAPGTEPRKTRRWRSASTFTTGRPRTVTRRPPMRPGMRRPLNTRPGNVDPLRPPVPRWYLEPWLMGPREKPCRLMLPAKPLPREVPLTSTYCPSLNMLTSMTWPSSSWAPASSGNSRSRRVGSTPAFWKWPFICRVTLRSLTLP